MAGPYPSTALPVGTQIEYDGLSVRKTHESAHEPFPWTSFEGTPYSDEWASHAIAEGAAVSETKG